MHAHSESPQSSALLAHVVTQTQANIDFLVSQNYLRASDAASILSKLASLSDDAQSETRSHTNVNGNNNEERNPVLSVADRLRQLNTGGSLNADREEREDPPKAVMAPTRRIVPPPPSSAPRNPQAKALWDYNADGSDPNDLSFRAGDIIELMNETNADWWTGRHTKTGQQGLFPSNYVEKLPSPLSVASPSPSRSPIPVPEPYSSAPPPFLSGPANGGWNSAPPPAWQPPSQPPAQYGYDKEKQGQMYAPPPFGPPLQPQQLQVQQATPPPVPTPEPEKKKKFGGGLGKTMANSAAGGLGFGAGAAVGSGIINSIF